MGGKSSKTEDSGEPAEGTSSGGDDNKFGEWSWEFPAQFVALFRVVVISLSAAGTPAFVHAGGWGRRRQQCYL